MVLSSEELETKYYDIYNTYTTIENNYKSNILSIGQVLKDKYGDFQTNYVKLFRKILTDQVTEHFLQTIIAIHQNTLEESKRTRFENDNPDVYKIIVEGKIHELLGQIQVIRKNIHDYREGYKQDYVADIEKAKSSFIQKYRGLITQKRYKMLFLGWINQTMPHDVTSRLLKSFKKLNKNELNDHDSAAEYSQYIVDEYIKPNIPTKKP
jgi:hypothetical protein